MKNSTKNTEVLCLSPNPRESVLQVSCNALQQVQKFIYLGVVFTSDRRRRDEIDIRIAKANAYFCVSFIVLCSQSGSFQTLQRCQFLNRSWFRSSPTVWSLILGNDRKNIISGASGRDEIFV